MTGIQQIAIAVVQHQDQFLAGPRAQDQVLAGYWEFPGGIQKRLHLHARHIDVPHPDGGRLKVTAPLPPHMVQSWNLLGFDASQYDPETNDPEE